MTEQDKNAEIERLREELRRARLVNDRLRHTANGLQNKIVLLRELVAQKRVG